MFLFKKVKVPLYLFLVSFLTVNYSIVFGQDIVTQEGEVIRAKTFREGTIYLKGQVKNAKKPNISIGLTDFFGYNAENIEIGEDGEFFESFNITNSQNLWLVINDERIRFTVTPGDTVSLYWDDEDYLNSFSIANSNELLGKRMQIEWAVHQSTRPLVMELFESLSANAEGLSDQDKFDLVNNIFTQSVNEILKFQKHPYYFTTDMLTDSYFYYSNYLMNLDIFDEYKLYLDTAKLESIPSFSNVDPRVRELWYKEKGYSDVNKFWMLEMPMYRDFIASYISRSQMIFNVRTNQPKREDEWKKSYYLAKLVFDDPLMQDWYLTERIITEMKYGEREKDTKKLKDLFLQESGTEFFKQAIHKVENELGRLGEGTIAPDFQLKDEHGKYVALSDFNGKVVYIDFWSLTCGPCIYEFKNYSSQFYEEYSKKDVVVLNICLDDNETKWKEALKKYNLHGVNLMDPSGFGGEIGKSYYLHAVPRYVIVGKDGKIENNDANRPSEILLGHDKGELLKALEASN